MEEQKIVYTLEFEDEALEEIKALKKSEISAYNKLLRLLEELQEHPYTGTGKPKALQHDLSGLFSRRITQKHRLVYRIDNDEISVLIISTLSHYSDK